MFFDHRHRTSFSRYTATATSWWIGKRGAAPTWRRRLRLLQQNPTTEPDLKKMNAIVLSYGTFHFPQV